MLDSGGSRRNSIELVGTKAGTAMPAEMREVLHLQGLVPAGIEDFTKQEMRAFRQLMTKTSNLEKYEFLAGLRCISVNLFYRLVLNHFKEIAPIIYTPTVGDACLNYSYIYPFIYPSKASVGLFITLKDTECIDTVMENYRNNMAQYVDPEVAVITDGSRILGLGDLG
ncbi:hypothetical protein H4R19_003583, partial [Coemansia spiralis]